MKRDFKYWLRRWFLGRNWRYEYRLGTETSWSELVYYDTAVSMALGTYGTGRIRYVEHIPKPAKGILEELGT